MKQTLSLWNEVRGYVEFLKQFNSLIFEPDNQSHKSLTPLNLIMERDLKIFAIGMKPTHPLASLGPLHTRDWEPVTITLQALSLVEKAEPVQVRFTLRLRDQWSMWMQDGCKVYMDSYMASNRSCFMVTWTILKNHHLLKVGLTHNRETMTLWTLTTVDLLYLIMHEDLHE